MVFPPEGIFTVANSPENSRIEPLNQPMTASHLECGGKLNATPL
jgi:hypothetical protein